VPHVLTAHSLEPLRPWKAEQLGGGYRVSSWIERQAYETADRVIAVSDGMRRDILRSYPSIDESKVEVVYNGIDLEGWQRVEDAELVRSLGIDPDRPSVVFVGRITRQKGLPYLLRAAKLLPADVQLVLCAGAPDTPEIMAEVTGLVRELQEQRTGVVWIDTVLPRHQLSAVLSQATTFVCPSVYEPLGIVNLEAMACGVPVVGSDTGGIPEVVADGLTGRIVPLEQVQDGTGTPVDPDRFVADLAATLTEVVSDPALARLMGRAGRMRAEEEFSWGRIAEQTLRIYRGLLN
jgi:starch synthase